MSIHGYRFTFKHLCWHSITKILRNGPRAHFPFRGPSSLGPCRHYQGCPAVGSAPSPPRAPGAPKGRSAQAQSRRPEDQPPARPARAMTLGAQAGRPDSLGSPQLPRPRGEVPPRPAPVLQTGTLMPRPWIPTVPAHSGAGSMTPGPTEREMCLWAISKYFGD
jgi:hypothetical protein